jgi:hypothetical protein
MSVSFHPITHWLPLTLASVAVMGLTVWAYRHRFRGTSGRWRWVALGLRLAAVLLCLLAALRPSVIFQEKKKQSVTVVFLEDRSRSGTVADEAGAQKRWVHQRKVLKEGLAAAHALGPETEVKPFGFADKLHELNPDDETEPTGRETAIGTSLRETVKRFSGQRISLIVLLSDGANNAGVAPHQAARELKTQQIPVVSVAFGTETAGAGSRNIVVRDLVVPPTVFVKNQVEVKGNLIARGFPNHELNVEMLVEGQSEPVATKKIKVPEGAGEVIPITGLKYIPQSAGEKKITLRVKPEKGEVIETDNEISTFLTVLKGGLNVLYLMGGNFGWDFKYLYRSLDSSENIHLDGKVMRRAAQGETGDLPDSDLAPGRYDVYILGDLPAEQLTQSQQRKLADLVEQGSAGLMMLGGRSSFGPGHWGSTEVARVLPVEVHVGDGQYEPEGGVKFIPNADALDSFVLQVGRDRAESAKIWDRLPPMTGTNRFGKPTKLALVLGSATIDGRPEPIMLSTDIGRGRTLVFGGETWVWSRTTDEGRAAHKKFWRQAILWLAHKEDQGDNQVKIKLDSRRIAMNQTLEFSVTARDSKGQPLPDVTYKGSLTREGAEDKPTDVQIYRQGDEGKGSYYADQEPGTYKLTVTASSKGNVVGTDSVRFLVYQDDREMENPAADSALLRQIAEITGGTSLKPEELGKYLKALSGKMVSEYVTQSEVRIWDRWPFLLLFAALLTLEWWVRKRHGWV